MNIQMHEFHGINIYDIRNVSTFKKIKMDLAFIIIETM
jgi:hypothetical protein